MSSKAMSLKARIRNLAKERGVPAQALLANYMFECYLDRLSQSTFKGNFVIKGGMLIASLVGLDNRSTMDLDATVRDMRLSEERLRSAMAVICSVPADDGVTFMLKSIAPIRPDDAYGGFRVGLIATLDSIQVPISIDVTTGDVMTPDAVRYLHYGMLDDGKAIEVWAYNIETIMAEKLETILSRGVNNTRPRDFYDVHILSTTKPYSPKLLKEALLMTAKHRGTAEKISDGAILILAMSGSEVLQSMWRKYQQQFPYAAHLNWMTVMRSLNEVFDRMD